MTGGSITDPDTAAEHLIHASCVAIDGAGTGAGILLRGASGAGKSDLALRLMSSGATLVADDYCLITRTGDIVVAHAPANIAGKIEVRGLGIIDMAYAAETRVMLIVDLAPDYPRMPPDGDMATVLGVSIARITLNPFEASAPDKVRLALACALRDTTPHAG